MTPLRLAQQQPAYLAATQLWHDRHEAHDERVGRVEAKAGLIALQQAA